jgi:hypothetical protein
MVILQLSPDVPCEMFPSTPLTTDGQVEENLQRGFISSQL